MSEVRIMTDSVAGIPPELAEKYRIKVIPGALIHYDGQTYIDNVTLSRPDAYALIKKDPDKFTTSALSPGYIVDEYRELIKESKNILHITLAQELSATFSTASMAAETVQAESPEVQIRVLDSKTAAGAQGLVVLEAAEAALQGMDIDRICDIVQQARQKTGGIMMWDTLRYVYRTGRMSKIAARLVSLLNVKPISRITDVGSVELVTRVRKREEGYKRLIALIKEEARTNSLRFMIMHSASPEWAEEFSKLLENEFDCQEIIVSEYSPIMGYATGPGAIFVGFRS
jgi:DegV family protein with EDD domain